MTVRASDLPKHARDRLPQPAPRRKRTAEARDETVRWAHFRCAACGEPNRTKAAAERHADATGHRRIECVLFPGEGTRP